MSISYWNLACVFSMSLPLLYTFFFCKWNFFSFFYCLSLFTIIVTIRILIIVYLMQYIISGYIHCRNQLLSHKLFFLLLFLFAHTKHEEQKKKNEWKRKKKGSTQMSLCINIKQLKRKKKGKRKREESKKCKVRLFFFSYDEIN